MIGKKRMPIIGAAMLFLMTVGIMAIMVTPKSSGGVSSTSTLDLDWTNSTILVSDTALQCYSCNVSLEWINSILG